LPAEGGPARRVTQPDRPRDWAHLWPHFLPGGRAALLDVSHPDSTHDVAVVDLSDGRVRTLVERAAFPRFAASGHLLFGRKGTLYAAPFDAERLALTGAPTPVLDGVVMWDHPAITGPVSGFASYDLALDGILLFCPLENRLPKRTLVWLDRRGRTTPASPSQRSYEGAALSPDGRQVATTVSWDVGSRDVFVLDLERQAWTRVTVDAQAYALSWL